MRRNTLALFLLALPLACADDSTTATTLDMSTVFGDGDGDTNTETGDGDGDPAGDGDGDGDTGDGDGDTAGDGDGDTAGDGDGDTAGDGDGDPPPPPGCGDGIVDDDEECDVGNETMFCDADCTFTVCGDGYHNMLAEECDDGNGESNDACVGPCLINVCGDGYLYEGVEECDDNNLEDSDDCTSTCVAAFCGDGIMHADDEECDDANMIDNDACTAMCTASFCGDGVIWEGMETCDDGNMLDTDACPSCQPATCGDGFVEAGIEECDDANDINDDFCTNGCLYNGVGASCKAILAAVPNTPDGIYPIDPDGNGPGTPGLVYCDMTTDGGGWTLVASTRTEPLQDQASAYYDDLQTINPVGAHLGVWDGMRPLAAGDSDIRFTCMADPDAGEFDVDLSFYNILWYGEFTTGTETESCFSESNGVNDDQPTPARRDNINNASLMANDQWGAGYLEGEDSCNSPTDFTVDFDDRGMDSNQSDGTDWGQDDGSSKCGMSGIQDGAWHIWVREL